MEDITVTPQLIQELQQFESKKNIYMTEEDVKHEIEDLDRQPKRFKYYFQHPNLRILVALTVTILNFYMFAEDPVSHSVTNCHIPLIGDIYSMMFANYPPNGYSAVKVCLWLFAIIFGIIVGKYFVHYWLFCCKLKLKLFSKDGQGSWMITFLFTLCVIFYQSAIYNAILILEGKEMDKYHSTDDMHIENKTFMKIAAICTWLGDFFTLWMVFDMMLQEKKYHHWLRPVRKWWQARYNRVIAFWFVCFTMTIIVVVGITTDFIDWDGMNRGMVSTNELSRSFLASAILIFDLVIIMQDWDFPHFSSTIDVKLPGVHSNEVFFTLPSCCAVNDPRVRISGKWFNYGILFIVMILDLNMWKNQILYDPFTYGQYVNDKGQIFTVTNKSFLAIANRSMLTYEYRWYNESMIGANDHMTLSTYKEYHTNLKGIAFLPSILGFFVFIYLVYSFAQMESDQEKLVKNWYESKFVKKRKSRRIEPIVEQDSDSDSDIESEIIDKNQSNKFNYYFQHPFGRLIIAYTGVVLSWFVIAEDPIGHSLALSRVDVLGNDFSLIFGSYPKKTEFALLKVFIWVCAFVSGLWVGKYMIHHLLLIGILRIKLFSKGQGSWIIIFITLVISLYCWSLVFNGIVKSNPELSSYYVTNQMGITFKTFTKGVAILSFLSHFTLVLMITDTLLQEKHYPSWAKWIRTKWHGKYLRITLFWAVGLCMTAIAIIAISADLLSWDGMSSNLAATNELGRSCLAGFVILLDVLVITQDWEFPRFKPNPSIKLPGLSIAKFNFELCCMKFELKGKWFTYGLLGVILLIDCYNFKNQLMYEPHNYEQYTDHNNYIVTILDEKLFINGNTTNFNRTIYGKDQIRKLHLTYNNYTMGEKIISFLPILMAIIHFIGFGMKRSLENKKLSERRKTT